MAMSSNNWGTNTFQYEEYDPNRDIINLEGLKQQDEREKGPPMSLFAQGNVGSNSLHNEAIDVYDGNQEQISKTILNQIGEKILNKEEPLQKYPSFKRVESMKVVDFEESPAAN